MTCTHFPTLLLEIVFGVLVASAYVTAQPTASLAETVASPGELAASKLTDLMVAAPTPLSATRFSRDLDVPRNPDGRIVGFDIFIPHRTVLRFGVVIYFWTQINVDIKDFKIYQKEGVC